MSHRDRDDPLWRQAAGKPCSFEQQVKRFAYRIRTIYGAHTPNLSQLIGVKDHGPCLTRQRRQRTTQIRLSEVNPKLRFLSTRWRGENGTACEQPPAEYRYREA